MDEASQSFFVRHQFLIRRLHSLSGLIPIGAFLVLHLVTNASVLGGPASFQANVDRIHSLGVILPVVEWLFIFIPLIFHAVVGFAIIQGGLPNTGSYPYSGNIRYTLQRATGIIAFVFIFAHVLHLHWVGEPLKNVNEEVFAQFEPESATSSTAAALQASLLVQFFYAVGILSTVFHLANGIWTLGITWGLWTTPDAMRRANYVSLTVGVVLGAIGLGALGGFVDTDREEAVVIEKRLQRGQQIMHGEVAVGVDVAGSEESGEGESEQ
ncbi:MAG: succinate dehydrogenase [Pirellulales bacterium]